MPVAFDAAVESVRTATTDPYSWTHTPTGTPRAIVVAAVHGTSSTDHVSTVTYGGVSMSRVVRATDTATEAGAAELWFLGASIPTGNQTVEANLASATTDDIHFVSMSFTADRDCTVLDFDSINNNVANPSVTLQYTNRIALAVAAHYGGGAAPSSFTPNGNCQTVHDHDLGAFYSEVIRQTTPGSADFAIGGTSATDDVAFAALAVTDGSIIMPADGTTYDWTPTAATLTHVGRFHLVPSAYIAASAADVTTARLTAPSGKSTSDFDAGFISDDTNPLPTIDITADDYTEVEWCVEAAAGLTTDDVFEFRVVDSADTPLDTYTVTPTWTIGTAVNNYSLTADAASWAWDGATVGLVAGFLLSAGVATYAWAGTDAGLLAGYELQPEVAAYEWTPATANLLPGFAVVPAEAAYTWAVQDATLTYTPTGDFSLSAEEVAYSWVGTDATLAAGYRADAEAGAYAWAGTDAGLLLGALLGADAGAWDWTVADATLTLMRPIRLVASAYIAGSAADPTTARLAAPSGKTTGDFEAGLISDDTNPMPTLNLGADAYTELEWCIETDASLIDDDVYEFRVVASDGTPLDTYSVTPTWTIGTGGAFSLTAEAASYDWTPSDAGLLAGYEVGAEATSWAWTPAAAGLTATRLLAAGAGAWAWTIGDAGLRATRFLAATGTAYDWVGTDAGLTATRTLAADALAWDWTVADATLDYGQLFSYTLDAEPVAYTWAVQDATLQPMSPPASYEWTPQAAGLLGGFRLTIDAGAWAWTGSDAGLLRGASITADPVAYTWTGTDADLVATAVGEYLLLADPAVYSWTVADAGLRRASPLTALPATYLWTVADAALWLNLGAPTLPPEPCYADLWAPTVRAHRLPIRAYARLGDAMRDYILMDAGDLLPAFQATLIDANNERVNLTGATAITLHLTRYRGLAEQASTPVEAEYTCSVVGDATEGVVTYAWQAGETDTAGNYRGYVHVLYSTGDDRRIPTSGFISLIIRP